MKPYHYILFLAFMLVSCGGSHSDEPIPVMPEQPETPDVPGVAEYPMTFAVPEATVSRDGTPMQDTYKLFKVWSYKHTSANTTETVMPGYQVKYLDDSFRWQYDGTTYTAHPEIADQFLKYWDASATSYDFYAFAPVSVSDNINIDVDATGLKINAFAAHTTSTPDLLVAHQHRDLDYNGTLRDIDGLTNTLNDTQPATFSDPVPLVFHHLLSTVEYRIYNVGTKTAEIQDIIVNYDTGKTLNTSGDYINGTWTNYGSTSNSLMSMMYIAPNLLSLPPITQDNYKTHSHKLITYYEIPQQLNRYLNVTVRVNGETVSKRFDHGETYWNLGTKYVYYIRIEAGDPGSAPILIDLTVDDFIADDPIEDVQTNW